jgi:hypothetical protein
MSAQKGAICTRMPELFHSRPVDIQSSHYRGRGSVLVYLFGYLLCLMVGASIGTCQALPRGGLSSGAVRGNW